MRAEPRRGAALEIAEWLLGGAAAVLWDHFIRRYSMRLWTNSLPRRKRQVKATKARVSRQPSGAKLSSLGFESLEYRVLLAADLTVAKTGLPPAAAPGELLTYNITVANAAGTTAATSTVLTDALPAGETFVSATTTQGTVSTSGNTVTIDAFVNSSATGTLSNTASVTSPDDPGSPKTSTAVVTTVNSLPATATDVSVTATSSPTTGTVGSPETYTLTITNNDPTNTATNVTLTDVLPAGSTFGAGTATGGGTVTQALGVATVTYPTLAPGASQTVTLTATPTTPGVAVNSAAVTPTSGDPNLANNVAVPANPVAGTLTPGVDMTITKKANQHNSHG